MSSTSNPTVRNKYTFKQLSRNITKNVFILFVLNVLTLKPFDLYLETTIYINSSSSVFSPFVSKLVFDHDLQPISPISAFSKTTDDHVHHDRYWKVFRYFQINYDLLNVKKKDSVLKKNVILINARGRKILSAKPKLRVQKQFFLIANIAFDLNSFKFDRQIVTV